MRLSNARWPSWPPAKRATTAYEPDGTRCNNAHSHTDKATYLMRFCNHDAQRNSPDPHPALFTRARRTICLGMGLKLMSFTSPGTSATPLTRYGEPRAAGLAGSGDGSAEGQPLCVADQPRAHGCRALAAVR